MSHGVQTQTNGSFDENEWLRMLFMLSDMHNWLSEMEQDLFMKQPSGKKKKLFRKSYYLTATSFAHIIERHYYKIPRHLGAGKFTISVPAILDCLQTGFSQPPVRLPGSSNFMREFSTGGVIGFDKAGHNTSIITIITNAGGKILTAFPGVYRPSSFPSKTISDNGSPSDALPVVEEEEGVYTIKRKFSIFNSHPAKRRDSMRNGPRYLGIT